MKKYLAIWWILFVGLAIGCWLPREAAAQNKKADLPNILWITAEDMSPTLGCYGDQYATTPNLDKLAKQSVVYTQAFASSPVCSPSRSCLITGMYPASMGTQQMRSAFPLPEGVKGFPNLLREAGYYTTNNVKTDYNTSDEARLIEESWDESSATAHWRNEGRKKGQPFFAVFNDMTSHQSRTMVWPHEVFREQVQSKLSADEVHDPDKAPIPPYYPDTPEIRKTIARYYDCVTVMDQNVGRILAELEADGLADDTIVFFYSDHGSGMPRHKRNLHDSGMQVALMIRFPEKYQHLATAEPGTKTDRLVSFVDFPPTVLGLAGIKPPPYMQGLRFLGPDEPAARRHVYGTRDRVDEVFDTSRSLRDGRYLYIRNYRPELSWMQPSVFSDLGDIRDVITEIARTKPETLTKEQLAYAGPVRPPEEFYDSQEDPQNLVNLANAELDREQQTLLKAMREKYREIRGEIQDVGALPEGEMRRLVESEGAPMRDIMLGKTDHQPDLAKAWAAADQVGIAKPEALLETLESPVSAARCWAVIGLRYAAYDEVKVQETVAPHLEDVEPAVRIETASWLAHFEPYRDVSLKVLAAELDNEVWPTALRACRAIELLGEDAAALKPVMRALYDRTRHAKGDENFFIAFSSGAFLEKLGEAVEPWDFTPGAGSFSADPPGKDAKKK